MYHYIYLLVAFFLLTITQLSAYEETHGALYNSFFHHKYASFSTALLHISYIQLILRNINVHWTFHFNLC